MIETRGTASRAEWLEAMIKAGLAVEGLKVDGHIHRVQTESDEPDRQTGFYYLADVDGNLAEGGFGDWASMWALMYKNATPRDISKWREQ